jgi:hypothetical protein
MVRKLIEFDAATMTALKLLASDSVSTLQELADEAFRDLLKKHGRPTNLKEALRQSLRKHPANDRGAHLKRGK